MTDILQNNSVATSKTKIPESDMVNDIDVFIEKLDSAASIRTKLDNGPRKTLNATLKCMAMLYSTKPSTMKKLSDLYYYSGGYPSPNSPSKIEVLVNSMTDSIVFLDMLGDLDLLLAPLKEVYGINITISKNENYPKINHDIIGDTKFVENLVESGLEDDFNQMAAHDDADVLNLFLDKCLETQAIICQMADSIKIDLYDEIKTAVAPGISKGTFVGAVRQNIQYEKMVAKNKRNEADQKTEVKIKGYKQAIHVTELANKI